MKSRQHVAANSLVILALSACTPGEQISRETEPFDGIGEQETVTLLGTEPFWSFEISGNRATYTEPENPTGSQFTVARFAGNNGLSFTGELDGQSVTIAVTPGACSDGMSDREFPYTATVALGDRQLEGCGYTDQQPFTGDPAP